MKVLLLGASGQVGRELQRTVPAGVKLVPLSRSQLDICDSGAVLLCVTSERPDVIVNCAAFTAVDKPESDVTAAYAVNEGGARAIAQATERIRARMVHVSTDFVFDGTANRAYLPGDRANPLNVYGASKLAGEIAVRNIRGASALIVRTGWVYSIFGNNFVKTILRLAASRQELNVVHDQIGTPTWAKGLAGAIWQSVAAKRQGTLHWSDAGVASWYDFAVAIVDEAHMAGLLDTVPTIRAVATCDYPLSAKRPGFAVLDESATWLQLARQSPHWRAALREMLAELKPIGNG